MFYNFQIKLDETFDAKTKCDESNALVLPSKKRKTKIKETKVTVTKLLSKSKRKQLEKIVERRHKKQNVSINPIPNYLTGLLSRRLLRLRLI